LENFYSRLVRQDAIPYFTNNWERVLEHWINMQKFTALPDNISSSDPRVISAFRELDGFISGVNGDRILKRLACIQLLRVFERLEDIISSESSYGTLQRQSGRGNASIAIDIFKSALQRPIQKYYVAELKRTARGLRELAGPSPFFLVIYSGIAEAVLWV
jgi:hypothetical protein